MTKQEFLEAFKKKRAALAEAEEVKKAEDTNPDTKAVEDVKPAEGMPSSELPTQKEVEKEVNAAVDPVVDADKDGVSKNGGEAELTDTSVETEKKKEDKSAKDAINVSERTYEEQVEVNNELLAKLQEAKEQNAKLAKEVALIKESATAALKDREKMIATKFEERMVDILEDIRVHGTKIEESLKAEAAKAKKTLALAESFSKASLKLNNILLNQLKSNQAEKKMLCVESYKARVSGRAKRFGN